VAITAEYNLRLIYILFLFDFLMIFVYYFYDYFIIISILLLILLLGLLNAFGALTRLLECQEEHPAYKN